MTLWDRVQHPLLTRHYHGEGRPDTLTIDDFPEYIAVETALLHEGVTCLALRDDVLSITVSNGYCRYRVVDRPAERHPLRAAESLG